MRTSFFMSFVNHKNHIYINFPLFDDENSITNVAADLESFSIINIIYFFLVSPTSKEYQVPYQFSLSLAFPLLVPLIIVPPDKNIQFFFYPFMSLTVIK